MRLNRLGWVGCVSVVVMCPHPVARADGPCALSWTEGFDRTGPISDALVFDDGTGPALYVTGSFTSIGGIAAGCVAKWDGLAWSPLGTGLAGGGSSAGGLRLAIFDDDGPGPNPSSLYVGGRFDTAGGLPARGIARWDGQNWWPVGAGVDDPDPYRIPAVLALEVFDFDGPGPQNAQLYVGGKFPTAGGVTVNNIARWDGANWSPLGIGFTAGFDDNRAAITDLAVLDADGAGPDQPVLYAGGDFQGSGFRNVACWSGTSWLPLANLLHSVRSMVVFDSDGPGPASPLLHVAAGASSQARVFVLTGSSWSALSASTAYVDRLAVLDADGPGPSGEALYAAGGFMEIGGVPANRIARWSGATWLALGAGFPGSGSTYTHAMAVFDRDGIGPLSPALYVGGLFNQISGGDASNLAAWDGAAWSSDFEQGNGIAGYDLIVDTFEVGAYALASFDDGAGEKLFAGGVFDRAGDLPVSNIARWDGLSWSAAGDELNGSVQALAPFDPDGVGPTPPALYAGGTGFRFARWDGGGWQVLGGALSNGFAIGVYDLLEWDSDGSGPSPPALYLGGNFTHAASQLVNGIAKWNGASWSPLGGGVNVEVGSSRGVEALAVFDDGSGSALYAAGFFETAGGMTVNSIAKWDGVAWSSLGSGLLGSATALCVFDDGAGPRLFVGGNFTSAGGVPAANIAKWDGTTWSAVGSGLTHIVRCLNVLDQDGAGPTPPRLCAGGWFVATGVAAWDGNSWQQLGDDPVRPDLHGAVDSLATFDDGRGPALFAGGRFEQLGGAGAARIARWGPRAPYVIVHPQSVDACAGSAIAMTVQADGGPDLQYQWRHNGVELTDGGNVSGSATQTLTIDPLDALDAGNYDVLLADGCGTTLSGQGLLTVHIRPEITTEPADQQVPEGSSARFSVDAHGFGAMSWQWRKDGVDLVDGGGVVGANQPTLDLSNLDLTDSGAYDVVVGDDCSTTTSRQAVLRVIWLCGCDSNCDGSTNLFDIQPFVDALSASPPAPCSPCANDANADGSVNLFDIQPFVVCLGG